METGKRRTMALNKDLGSEVAGLRDTIAAMAQGLRQMLEVQEAHTAMLKQILLASAAPVEKEATLSAFIEQLIAELRRQNAMLSKVMLTVDQLPVEVGKAVSVGVRDVLTKL